MVAQIASFTNPDIEYDVTVENGLAVFCTCPNHIHRLGNNCKHMQAMNEAIQAEVDRAARFLAVKKQVQGMEETWRINREIAWDTRF